MIYLWGLVSSNKTKVLASFTSCQGQGKFILSYRNLVGRFLATDHAPMLLMSATCRPVAIKAIMSNLKLAESDIEVHRGELTRPELRFIRITMTHSLKSAKDVALLFAHETYIPSANIPPTLVYSGKQAGTLNVLKALTCARGSPADSRNGRSSFARIFHATTGAKDKVERIQDFLLGAFVVMCCTLALGLGQNWTFIRRVIVVGRMDPSTSGQMLGRTGRDGRTGLAIMLVESTRRNGKNQVADFTDPFNMTDNDRMDAIAITKICLRIAFAVDNQ